MVIGSAALVIVLSVMNGFEHEVRRRIINADAHIRLAQFHQKPFADYDQLAEKIGEVPHVVGTSPLIEEKGLLVSPSGSGGVAVRGVEPEMLKAVTSLDSILYEGSFFEKRDDGLPGIVVGLFLKDNLALQIGDTVTLISPSGLFSGFSLPRTLRFRVDGIFETGLMEYDNLYCYIPLEAAQGLFNMMGEVTGIDVKLDNLYLADQVKLELIEMLGPYPFHPFTWFEMKPNLYNWMKIEKWMMFIVLSLIIMVAAFNITSSLIMMVLEKKRDIGILKSMGATANNIKRIFTFEGLVVGFIGGTVGLLIGFIVCFLQYKYHFLNLPGDVYIINFFPILIKPLDFLLVWLAAIALSLLAAYYPALWAAKLHPAEAIRYE